MGCLVSFDFKMAICSNLVFKIVNSPLNQAHGHCYPAHNPQLPLSDVGLEFMDQRLGVSHVDPDTIFGLCSCLICQW